MGVVLEVDPEAARDAQAGVGDQDQAVVLDVGAEAGGRAHAPVLAQPFQRLARAFPDVVAGEEELRQPQAGQLVVGAAAVAL